MMLAHSAFGLPVLALSVIAVGTFAGVPAKAADPAEQSVRVLYRDLDLKSDSGVATLHHRIARAASEVCGSVDPRELALNAQVQACRTAAIAKATPQVETVIASIRSGTRYAGAIVMAAK